MTAAAHTTQEGPSTDAASAGRPARLSLILALCCSAQFMVILDLSIVNIALPTIHASLGFSTADLQWVTNAYAITFAGFLMLGGRAADLLGQRRVFAVGLALFALTSVAGGLAGSQAVLIAARAAQGFAGAIIAPASLSIITTTFSEGPERNRAVGLWGAMAGAGGATGVLLGGVLTDALSWRWVFLINLPIGATAAIGTWLLVTERRREAQRGFDFAGAVTLTGGLVSLVYGIVNASPHGWGSALTIGPIAGGLALLAAFIVIEGRVAAAPLVPLRLFSSRTLTAANVIVLLLGAAIFGMWFHAGLYLQEVLRLSPLGAGLAFLPMALTIVACAQIAGKLVGRVGPGRVLGVGLTLLASGLFLFTRVRANGGYVADFVAPGLLSSAGIGLSFVPAAIAAVSGVEPQEAGVASALINTARQMGGALGLALLSTSAVSHTKHLINSNYTAPIVAITDGFHRAFLIGGAFAALGAIVAFRILARQPARQGRATEPREPAEQAA